jgi:probable rRNA maturation factor
LVILQKSVAGVSAAALNRFVLRARKAAGLAGTVNVLVTSSAAMHSLNSRFRNKDKPTDVLSFPSNSSGAPGNSFAGEIAVSGDIAKQNSARLGHSAALEVKILVLHGILHLAGFDHERDNGEMARKEASLRQALRLPSALIERSDPPRAHSAPRRRRSRNAKRTA